MTRVVLLAAVGVLAVSGCGRGDTGAGAPDSGVEGHTMVDGGCPILRPGSPCPDLPIRARITVTGPDGEQVTTQETGVDGRFRIPLPPGSYLLHPANTTDALLPRALPVRATVTAGRYQDVRIMFDSGIRAPSPGG
ncbi:MAG: hypothetical protein ACJ73E_07520 [Mycobacteriales bacterium]